jgi:hypothetical protein
MKPYRLARWAEVVYAAIQGAVAYYVSHLLRASNHPLPPRTLLLAGWIPVTVALVLAVLLRPRSRWVWWPAGAFALYVLVASVVAVTRVARIPSHLWPSHAWLGFAMIGVRLLMQALVVNAAFLTLRRQAVRVSPVGSGVAEPPERTEARS